MHCIYANYLLSSEYHISKPSFESSIFILLMQRPAYIDPQTGEWFDTNNPSMKGWMTKQSMWLKDWRRRYFLLKGSKLFFCKTEHCAPHGMIDLSKCMTGVEY